MDANIILAKIEKTAREHNAEYLFDYIKCARATQAALAVSGKKETEVLQNVEKDLRYDIMTSMMEAVVLIMGENSEDLSYDEMETILTDIPETIPAGPPAKHTS